MRPRLRWALLVLLAGCGAPAGSGDWGLEGEAFGTRWSVRLRGVETPAIRGAVEAELDLVDRAMSNWRDDSELSRLNRSDAAEPFPLGEPLALVLETALAVHEASGGAFDVTVGPLLRLFGFGPGADPDARPPDSGAVEAARSRVGSSRLLVERLGDGRAVLRRSAPRIEVDLSGIAKGYAVDRVSAALASLGFADHLVEIGGEIRASGRWRVGIEAPGALGARIHRSFPVEDLSVATSGGARDFRAADEPSRFWTHILDPRFGRPVERRQGSVTVLAPSCLEADAWATALFVLGPEAGLETAAREGLSALFLTAGEDGEIRERATSGFPPAGSR